MVCVCVCLCVSLALGLTVLLSHFILFTLCGLDPARLIFWNGLLERAEKNKEEIPPKGLPPRGKHSLAIWQIPYSVSFSRLLLIF